MTSESLRVRLARCESVLALLDRQRAETGNPDVGWALEKKLLAIELADLEGATLAQETNTPSKG